MSTVDDEWIVLVVVRPVPVPCTGTALTREVVHTVGCIQKSTQKFLVNSATSPSVAVVVVAFICPLIRGGMFPSSSARIP